MYDRKCIFSLGRCKVRSTSLPAIHTHAGCLHSVVKVLGLHCNALLLLLSPPMKQPMCFFNRTHSRHCFSVLLGNNGRPAGLCLDRQSLGAGVQSVGISSGMLANKIGRKGDTQTVFRMFAVLWDFVFQHYNDHSR